MNTTEPLLHKLCSSIVCSSMILEDAVCVRIMIVLSNCSASWWTDRLACRAADWRAGHSGDSRHFASPGSVMRDRGHHRGPADTWVPLRESTPHLASSFYLPTPN